MPPIREAFLRNNMSTQEPTKDPIESLSKSERDKLFTTFILIHNQSKKYVHVGTDLKNPLVNNIFINLVDTFSSSTVFSSMSAIVSLVNYIKSNHPDEFKKIKNTSIQTAYSFFTKLNTATIVDELGLDTPVETPNTVVLAAPDLVKPLQENEVAQTTSPTTE